MWLCRLVFFFLVLVEFILLILRGLSHVRMWDVIRMDTRLCLYRCCGKILFMKEWYIRHSVLVTGKILVGKFGDDEGICSRWRQDLSWYFA